MRNLIKEPLELEAERINKVGFYSRFNENLETILDDSNEPSETEVKAKAAKDNISLCRAIISGFAAKGELKNVHEIIDHYGPWSHLMVQTIRSAVKGKQQETKDIRNYNIIYLPDCEEDNVRELLRELTISVSLVKSVKDKWKSFKKTGDWGEDVVVGDGGMGTALIERIGYGRGPIAWLNKEYGNEVHDIHKGHIDVGAQMVLTNTLDANRVALGKFARKEKYVKAIKDLNCIGVGIARKACKGADALVFGRMGPSRTEFYEELYLNDIEGNKKGKKVEEELRKAFTEQARILCEEGVDGIWIEGMTYLGEAVIAVEAVKEYTKKKLPKLPVICTMQFEYAERLGVIDFKTLNWGNSVKDVVKRLQKAGADMIGANCGSVVEEMPLLAHKMRELTKLPLVFRLDVGYDPQIRKYKNGDRRGPSEYAEIMSQVATAGGNIVAGCCWTRPDHIAALQSI